MSGGTWARQIESSSERYRHRPPPEAEHELVINELRGEGVDISAVILHLQALEVAAAYNKPDFRASWSWMKRFKIHNKLSMRARTRQGQTSPEALDRIAANFSREVRQMMQALGVTTVFNADQTAVFFEYLPARTLSKKGAKTVWVRCGGESKERATVMLLADSNGKKMAPFVVCKTGPSRHQDTREKTLAFVMVLAIVFGRRSTRSRKTRLSKCIATRKLLRFHFEGRENPAVPILLLWNDFSGHWTKEVTDYAASINVVLMKVPPSATAVCQPADMAWNPPFKQWQHGYWDHLKGRVPDVAFKLVPPDREVISNWIERAWAELSETTVKSRYKRAGLEVEEVEVVASEMISELASLSLVDARIGAVADEHDTIESSSLCTPARHNRQASLQVEKGGECIEEISVGSRSCYVVGRSEDLSDVWLQHPSISRQHAVVAHNKQEQICLMDLGSAQGTFVNGQEIKPNEPQTLQIGDSIKFGASTRTYVFQNKVQETEATQKQSKQTGAASADPELQKMMQEMQSFGQKNSDKMLGDTTTQERVKRQAEIAAMTAQMMQTRALVSDNTDAEEEAVREDSADDKEEVESESEDDGENEVALRYGLPKSHEVGLESHTKGLACIAVDAPGGRVATGSMDYHVKLWDFAGMARHVRPFRDIEVDDGHPLVAVSYSPSGDRLLAVTGSSQPKVLTREGVEELQFAKGDMYVVDMANTNGHTHTATGGQWHPTVRDQMITSSLDGTVRLWSLGGKQTFNKLINTSVFKFKDRRGRRCGVTTCRFSPDGLLIAGSTMDGQVQCIDPRKSYAGAAITIRDAHADGGGDVGVSSIRFSPDGKYMASRSCADDTIKIWDIRKPKQSVKEFRGIEGVFGTCNLAYNHSGTAVAAGTCVRKGKGLKGQVLFLDVHTPGLVEPVASIDMKEDESAVCVEWHYGINQVFVGSSTGSCRVFYDPRQSTKGVLLSATKKLKVQSNDSGVRIDGAGKVYTPHALPMYRDDTSSSRKRKYEKVRADPKRSRAPEKPITGPGMGGKISGSTTFTQYFMSSHIKSSFREEDPREAILKYAKEAEKDPQFLGAAYKKEKLDPRYQLAKQTLEEEKIAKEEEDRRLLQP
ncbi:LOW QUALITY PROTEIN: Hypothetical protein PHPALM_16802 [Phytophthora palmivora]|uniref:FHA domain-containing protein n=1 Tax=Phytophthora palmivora TaxID=4796 RepID=A0A2P4XNV5_9STRA|nr:LOW QUALITY PROTEIN: Hypothetical protein PHPALM_16802 [Phytophthora palmivora]